MSARLHAAGARARQGGVVLFVALIVLIIMTLAGLALLRQMGAGASIAGNIAFKENATSVADRGSEFARQWVQANSGLTASDLPAAGYWSSWALGVDPTAFDWNTQSRLLADDVLQTGQAGNTVRILIQRLCALANTGVAAPNQECSDAPVLNAGTSQGGAGYPGVIPGATPSPFYRITTRVEGPRSTISYTQMLMQ